MSCPAPPPRRYEFGEYTLDLVRGALLREGTEVALRPKSYAVLCYLVEHHGHLVAKEELLNAIWGHTAITEGTLTQCLLDIRRTIGDESHRLVRTVRGRGYLFDGPVTDSADPERMQGKPTAPQAPTRSASERTRTGWGILALGLILTATALWWSAAQRSTSGNPTPAEFSGLTAPDRSIAVLPFADLSPEQDQEYFSDGISEEILNRLSSFRDLHVIARTSSFAFKHTDYDIRRLSALLGVRHLLQGSVRKDGRAVRISAQLVDASGRQIWSDAFDRELADIFVIQTQIAEAVATSIVPQISLPASSAALPDVDAYQHFLGAREAVQKRVSWRYPQAIEELSRAIEIDPTFAEAYAERAVVILLNGFWTNDRGGDLDRAERDVQAALSLNPDLARAYAAQAMVVARRNGARTEDERLLRRALALDPNMVDARLWLFRALEAEGPNPEALEELEHAVRLDPLAPEAVAELAEIEARRGDFQPAEQRLLRLLQVPQPSDAAYSRLWWLYVETGRLAEAVEVGKRMILSTVAQGGRPARYYALIASYSHLGLWARAEDWQDRYNREYPEDYIIHLYPMWVDHIPTGNLVMQGRFREALELTRNTLESFGSSVTDARRDVVVHYGILQALAGDYPAAMRSLDERVDPDSRFDRTGIDALQALAWAHLRAGSSSYAAELLDLVERRMAKLQANGYLHIGIYLYLYAQNAALRGMTESAIERLRMAVDAGWRTYYRPLHDPRWNSVRNDPRFAAVIESVKADVDRQREDVNRQEAQDDFVVQLEASIANEAARRGVRKR